MESDERVWDVVAVVLAAAAIVTIVAEVFQAWGPGASGGPRDKLEVASRGATVYVAILPLGAVTVVYWLSRRFTAESALCRWAIGMTVVATVAIIIGGVYSIWGILTSRPQRDHVPFRTRDWPDPWDDGPTRTHGN